MDDTRIPVQVTFRNMDGSAAIEAKVRAAADKLAELHEGILGCRVLVDAQHRHQRKGRLFHVRVELAVPGTQIVISRDPEMDHSHEDPYVALRDAFDAARRRLQDHLRQRQGCVKVHEEHRTAAGA